MEVFLDSVAEGSGDEDPLVSIAVREQDNLHVSLSHNGQPGSVLEVGEDNGAADTFLRESRFSYGLPEGLKEYM